MSRAASRGAQPALWPGLPLILLLGLPVVALLVASSPSALATALRHPTLLSAIALSLRTSLLSLLLCVLLGTPLAWYLARSQSWVSRWIESLATLPIVLPPAVIGVALLELYGRDSVLGAALGTVGIALPFSSAAVVMAQLVVATPFYVRAASAGFRQVDPDMLLVARSLGATPRGAVLRVAVPAALPALAGGAALAWARALGEFGATLLFAGNLPGRSQTLPLAIYAALESDVGLARALALILAAVALTVLVLTWALGASRGVFDGHRARA